MKKTVTGTRTKLEPVYWKLAARIRMLRQILDVSQEQLAERAKVSRPTIANIEAARQRMSLHQVELIAAALGTHPRGLMKGMW